MRVAVTGATGQLGYDVCARLERLGMEPIRLAYPAFDLADSQGARQATLAAKPDAVIHCAAYTAVDLAQREAALCRQVNVEGTRAVAQACAQLGAKLLYISTDYVFAGEGDQPYETDAPTGPLNVYGQSKLDGEAAVLATVEKHWIVRTSWSFGVNGNNFVRAILKSGQEKPLLRVVDDQIGSPTSTEDLSALLCDLIQAERYGVYHATNEGFCDRYTFAAETLRMAGVRCELQPVKSADYPSAATRPLNSRLSKRSLTEAGFGLLPDWHASLERYIARITA